MQNSGGGLCQIYGYQSVSKGGHQHNGDICTRRSTITISFSYMVHYLKKVHSCLLGEGDFNDQNVASQLSSRPYQCNIRERVNLIITF